MLNWIRAGDHILVPISRTPHTAPFDAEIAGVTGSTLPNGVPIDRAENQITKAVTTFELGSQGAHSLQQQGQDQSDECPTFRDMTKDLDGPHLVICAISSASPESNTWAHRKQWERSTNNNPGLPQIHWVEEVHLTTGFSWIMQACRGDRKTTAFWWPKMGLT